MNHFIGKNVILYFYPKDNTPGCIIEGKGFAKHFKEFEQHNTVVLGISKDSLASHETFKKIFNFPFDLVSDPDKSICEKYGVLKEKSIFGRKYQGIERSTFLIDREGDLSKIWRNVGIKNHPTEVFQWITTIEKA